MNGRSQTKPERAARGSIPIRLKVSDVALAFCIAAIIALMVLPLRPVMLDFLIALNITVGMILMMIAVYIESAVEFTVFPTLLLITTLFRLSLSIATTRMILIHAEAGQIINTFGNVTAGGNLVIGLVVFLIITVVQFVVIAKGAERVAEVAARFTLDAMPGKQMSIDGDLKSGLIDKDEARERRKVVELESKLCGSLDGAMKFVKGDAIAGIIILIVNLLGGLMVGMMQNHLSFGDAIRLYSILTIGDGMVTQIPAVLAAIAAGLIITRTTDETKETHLADAIRRQFAHRPRIFLVAGVLAALMAAAPGFPAMVFLMLGAACIGLGVAADPELRGWVAARVAPWKPAWLPASAASLGQRRVEQNASNPLDRLVLELPAPLAEVEPQTGAQIQALLDGFNMELGVALPALTIRPAPTGQEGRWRLTADELVLGSGVLAEEATLSELLGDLRGLLRRNIAQFLGLQETAALVNQLNATHPDLVKEVHRAAPLPRLADVLRRLVAEEVSIRNLPAVLEAVTEAAQGEKETGAVAAYCRVALRRAIIQRYARDGALKVLAIAPALEAQLLEGLAPGSAGQQFGLKPMQAKRLIGAVRDRWASGKIHVVLVSADLRRPLRRLLETELFDLPVLSYAELHPSTRVEVVDSLSPMNPAHAAIA